MQVFLTGGSGFIGSAVVPVLLGAGHKVLALARTDSSAAALDAVGAEVLRGSLQDLDALRAGAAASDGVIHLAYVHDFADIAASGPVDLAAIDAVGTALEGTDRPLVIASGALGLAAAGGVATERDEPDPRGIAGPRIPSATATRALAARGVRSAVVRLAPTVHGAGDHGFVPFLIAIARERGVSGYVGDGANRWPAVHRSDAASLFRLALESAPAGSVLHGVAEPGVRTRDIAAAIGRQLGLPVESVPADRAVEHFGWIGHLFAVDAPVSGTLTQDLLDWRPTGPDLLTDLAQDHYYG